VIEVGDKQQINARAAHELQFLIGGGDQTRRAIRRKKLDRVGGKRHGYGLQTKLVRSPDHCFQNLSMSEVEAIEVADADNGWMRDVRIGQ